MSSTYGSSRTINWKGEIVFINSTDYIIYGSAVVLHGLSPDEFNSILLDEKMKITKRRHILQRFEEWELPDHSRKSIKRLLMSRVQNEEEREMVNQYIQSPIWI